MNRIIIIQVLLALPFFVYSKEPIAKQFVLDRQIIASIMFCSNGNEYFTYTKAETKNSYLQLVESCKNACSKSKIPVGTIITAKKLLIVACGGKQEGAIALSSETQQCIQELREVVEPNEVVVVPYLEESRRNFSIELRSSGLHWCTG